MDPLTLLLSGLLVISLILCVISWRLLLRKLALHGRVHQQARAAGNKPLRGESPLGAHIRAEERKRTDGQNSMRPSPRRRASGQASLTERYCEDLVRELRRDHTLERASAPVESLQAFVIHRHRGGWVLHAVIGGQARCCGADRRWAKDLAGVGAPFPSFHGVEWYLQEWRVKC